MTTGIHVYVRRNLDADQRHLLGTMTFSDLAGCDPVKLVTSWGLYMDDEATVETSLSGQFFIDAKTRETGFELVIHEDGDE